MMQLRQYIIITASYWAFTITDGALRMLVVLHFHNLGYSPLAIASLFLLYEFFGVITNLVGGWLAARIGLNITMHLGMALQIIALAMLCVDAEMLSVAYVMTAQALSGIAKDLNKMSAKSSIKLLVSDTAQTRLYRWVAMLTGSKNALKGVGFFIGAALLNSLGFKNALLSMATALSAVFVLSLFLLEKEQGKLPFKPKFKQLLSKSAPVNYLSAARLFLFGARDIWFVVALPVYLQSTLDWRHEYVGAFLACWIIGYGAVQSIAPYITSRLPARNTVVRWASLLSVLPAAIALSLTLGINPNLGIIAGLLIFGFIFAINSSIHSYLIVAYAKQQGVSLDVGFYYMSNAAGRLIGTLLSGVIYQLFGFNTCLIASTLFVVIAAVISIGLPQHSISQQTSTQ